MGGKYDDYDWAELPAEAKKAAQTLGYDKKKWDGDAKVPAEEKDWVELSTGEQAAATTLGYTQASWDSS
eukprot:scaffold4786_cov198-Amphora_coffeaeformis.AAC.15